MEKITEIHGRLLEGCIWDERCDALYFVDIEKFRIYRMTKADDLSFLSLPTYVSAIVLREDGKLLAALQDGLYTVDFERGETEKIMESGFSDEVRYNDGKCDRYGDLWLGSMYVDQSRPGAKGGGSLFCIRDGAVAAEYPSYTIPNGLDWMDGCFFHTETGEKKISVYEQEPGVRGVIGKKVSEIDLSAEKGSPDGMCIDRDGNLWIAMWGGFEVIGYDPRRKEVFKRLEVPDANVSCCVFGGKEKNRLFVTTAKDENGNGGEVYTVLLTDYCGKAGYRYGGR
ncbi:SMP-30/gluconolactonase/LRE family protein [Brotaphodocola sp.]|uniref:SMP-30/gluconolactonase/LRE family protein n=1 Tax=Brotaphodocola sp. TaxID=3073577 RepID=UPI003D7E9F64